MSGFLSEKCLKKIIIGGLAIANRSKKDSTRPQHLPDSFVLED